MTTTRVALHIFAAVLLGQAEWEGPNENEARCPSTRYDTAPNAASGGSVGPALRASPPAPRRHAAEAGGEEQKRRGLWVRGGRDTDRPRVEPSRGIQGGRGGREQRDGDES